MSRKCPRLQIPPSLKKVPKFFWHSILSENKIKSLDISAIKEEAQQEATNDPQDILKSFNKKSKTKDSDKDKGEDIFFGGPLSNRSAKTDPIIKSNFGKNGKFIEKLKFWMFLLGDDWNFTAQGLGMNNEREKMSPFDRFQNNLREIGEINNESFNNNNGDDKRRSFEIGLMKNKSYH